MQQTNKRYQGTRSKTARLQGKPSRDWKQALENKRNGF